MPKVSKHTLSPEKIKTLAERLAKTVLLLRDEKSLQSFFNDLLTPSEKIMLGKRLLIALFLERGHSYLDISRMLKVSEATIGGVNERLQNGGNGFRIAFKRLGRVEKPEELVECFGSALERMPSKASSGRW